MIEVILIGGNFDLQRKHIHEVQRFLHIDHEVDFPVTIGKNRCTALEPSKWDVYELIRTSSELYIYEYRTTTGR